MVTYALQLTVPVSCILCAKYILTYSMEQSPSWEANWFSANQEIPRNFGTRRFLTVLTSARHLSLSWANFIQSPQPPPTSWRSILILSSHLCLGLPYITWKNICLYQFHLRNYYADFHQNSYSRISARCSMTFLILGIPLSTPTSNHEEVGHPDSRYSLFSSVLPSFAATIPQIRAKARAC